MHSDSHAMVLQLNSKMRQLIFKIKFYLSTMQIRCIKLTSVEFVMRRFGGGGEGLQKNILIYISKP